MNEDVTIHTLEARIVKIEKTAGRRPPIGSHPDDARLDCEKCGDCMGLMDTPTGEIRIHYNGKSVHFTPQPGKRLVFHCRRCGHDCDPRPPAV